MIPNSPSYRIPKGSFLAPIALIGLMWIAGCSLLKDKDEPCICPPSLAGTTQALSCDCEPDVHLAFDSEAAWSPNGSTIAYVGTGNDSLSSFGIHLVDSDGSNKRLFHAGLAGAPAWSSDGHWIAFHEGAHIYKKHVTGDSLVQLTHEGRNFYPAWSPDGHWIAYDNSTCGNSSEPPPSNSCGTLLINNDGNGKRKLMQWARFPDWHPSGSHIMYSVRAVTQSGVVIGDSLWTYILSGNRGLFLTLLTGDNYDNRYPKYSPDGTRIVFQSQPTGKKVNVWVMNADGSGRRQLTSEGAINPSWSPDGQWIVYTETHETGRLWLMRPDGSGKHQLTFNDEI